MLVNSEEYWEQRFATGSWNENDGNVQSEYFANMALDFLPDWLKLEIKECHLSIIDVGCAEGDGTAILAREFPSSRVTGVDFSEKSIEKANKKFPYCCFEKMDIAEESVTADVVFCSNVLEHFKAPETVLENLFTENVKFVILLVPFKDVSGIDEHFFIFDYDFFPFFYKNFFQSQFIRIDKDVYNPSYWLGEQLLVVYSNQTVKDIRKFTSYSIYSNSILKNENRLLYKIENAARILTEKECALAQSLADIKRLSEDLQAKDHLLSQSLDDTRRLSEDLQAKDHLLLQSLEKEAALTSAISEKEELMTAYQEERERFLLESESLNCRVKELSEILDNRNDVVQMSQMLIDEQIKELCNLNSRIDMIVCRNNKLESSQIAQSLTLPLVQSLLNSKTGKLLHLFSRIKNQFLLGSWQEKKNFLIWLRLVFSGKTDLDYRWNPIYNIFNALNYNVYNRIRLETKLNKVISESASEEVIFFYSYCAMGYAAFSTSAAVGNEYWI